MHDWINFFVVNIRHVQNILLREVPPFFFIFKILEFGFFCVLEDELLRKGLEKFILQLTDDTPRKSHFNCFLSIRIRLVNYHLLSFLLCFPLWCTSWLYVKKRIFVSFKYQQFCFVFLGTIYSYSFSHFIVSTQKIKFHAWWLNCFQCFDNNSSFTNCRRLPKAKALFNKTNYF